MPCENGARICDENMSTQNQNIHEHKKDHNSSDHENKKPKKEDSSVSIKQKSVEKIPTKKITYIGEEKVSIPCRDSVSVYLLFIQSTFADFLKDSNK